MEALSDSCLGDDRRLAPGFRFHPTDEELVLYYLKRKICRKRLSANVIGETDVYKFDPEELPGQALYKTRDRKWFFFSPRQRKYPNGGRSSRATELGYWKATGKDRNLTCNSRAVGVKKTLVFHRGKAPNGQRTDWVMHEYTLDEEELKSCGNVKDYYVLYKIYKKSGPGPKNGEQYGAPFIEEEWADGDIPHVTRPFDSDILSNQLVGATDTDNILVNGLNHSVLDDCDLEEFMRPLTEEPVHAGLSAALTLQENEVPRVNSPAEMYNPVNLTEDDYLEINDLLASEPEPSSGEVVQRNWDLGGFGDLDEYALFDADSFLQDIDPIGPESASHPDTNPLGDGTDDKFDKQLKLDTSSAAYQNNQGQFEQQTGINRANHQPQLSACSTGQLSSRSLSQEQNNNALRAAQSYEMPLVTLAPGATCEPTNPLIADLTNEGGATKDESSEFASSLWAFLESIPATPASASESSLVSRALDRMSSLGRVRFAFRKTINNDSVTNNELAATRRRSRGNNNKGFFLLSILGALCAVLWVCNCIGGVGVSGRYALW